MAYKVKQGKEAYIVSARLQDGRKQFNGELGKATQEELKELFEIIPHLIDEVSKPKKQRKKKRDNDPDKPLPKPPTNEPKELSDKEDV